MKTTRNLLQMFAASALLLGFAACGEDNLYDPQAAQQISEQEFSANFQKRFGMPNPTQTWGFAQQTPMVQPEDIETGSSARRNTQHRAANPNSNEWSNYVRVPAAVTSEESEQVYLRAKDLTASDAVGINFSDFFVQQVYTGQQTYTTTPDPNGVTHQVTARNHMDYLVAGGEHVYNFNATNGTIMLMQNSSTAYFGFHDSYGNGTFNDSYIVFEYRGAYYVAFDYQSQSQNGNVLPDGEYTDWIIKVTPAEYKDASRIMCEDLGDTDDFDFNDVVFDVRYEQTWWPEQGVFAVIAIRAAGGELPVSVAGQDVHSIIGDASGKTIITPDPAFAKPLAIFRTKISSNPMESNLNPIDIPVVVKGKHQTFVLSAPQGQVPQKICVPSTVRWCKERIRIDNTYPKFPQWVKDGTPFWE